MRARGRPVMTTVGKPASSGSFGEALPDRTRFWFVPEDAAAHVEGRLLAVVPCDRFEQGGVYVLHIAGRLCIGRCHGAMEAQMIEITYSTTTTVVGRRHFDELVVGRMIGTVLLDGASGSS
jgi:hypothetical protein